MVTLGQSDLVPHEPRNTDEPPRQDPTARRASPPGHPPGHQQKPQTQACLCLNFSICKMSCTNGTCFSGKADRIR